MICSPSLFFVKMDKLYLAPVQGFTDYAYSSAHSDVVGGIDAYFTSFIAIERDGKVKKAHRKEMERYSALDSIVPQIQPANVEETKVLLDFILNYPVKNLNINAGCPSPMVVNKKRGVALLEHPETIAEIVSYIHSQTDLKVSIKTRLGIHDSSEIDQLLDLLNPADVDELIVHARTADQKYKGEVQIDAMNRIVEKYPMFHWVYNGDIVSVESFALTKSKLPSVSAWMIGRGVLQMPVLPLLIRRELGESVEDKPLLHETFMLRLFDLVVETSNDKSHAMNRIVTMSEYSKEMFADPQRLKRALRKSKSLEDMRLVIQKLEMKPF